MQKEFRAQVFGRVQLVMYRDFAARTARRLGLCGTVRNLPDGTVEVLAQGGEAALLTYIQKIKQGSLLSRVEKVEVTWREAGPALEKFKILYA